MYKKTTRQDKAGHDVRETALIADNVFDERNMHCWIG
jgi:hypothetical protein